MLPEGFKWRTLPDGPALYLGKRQLANITPLVNGKFRACLNPGNLAIHYEFFDSERESKHYVETWAATWESRLRHA